MREDNKNLLLAIALSVVVLIGWQYFFAPPTPPRPPAQPPVAQQTAPPPSPSQAGGPAAPLPGTAVPAPGAPGQAVEPRETALARSPRVAIDTPAIQGSVNLRGGRIDDVRLKHYRETVDPRSPNIVLLPPPGSQNPYYAEFGWVGAAAGALPAPDTVWTADARTLTPGQPLTLTWDNGQGLVFRRTIAVDERSMFTVKDVVEIRGSSPVTLHPYGLVSRHGRPSTLGYYVLHEGLIGVLGDKGLQEYTYDNVEKEPPLVGQATRGKAWNGIVGGFVGITDKYWAAAVVPNQGQPYQGSFTMRQEGAAKVYQANMLGDALTLAPGA